MSSKLSKINVSDHEISKKKLLIEDRIWMPFYQIDMWETTQATVFDKNNKAKE